MKKEQQDRIAHTSNGYAAPAYNNTTSSYAPRGRGTYNASYRGGPQRGGYAYGGRGATSYHPYQRVPPPHGTTKFKNRTVVFNKPDASAESSSVESGSAPGSAPLSTAHSRQNSQPATETKTLCATFTSTGTPDTFDEPRSFPLRAPLTLFRTMHSTRLSSPSRPRQTSALQALALQERLQQRRPLLTFTRAYPPQRPNVSSFPGGTMHKRGLPLCAHPRQSSSSDLRRIRATRLLREGC